MSLGHRRQEQLDAVDAMTPALRACVHAYGLPIVTVLTKHGIKRPEIIDEIVREIWHGPRQAVQRGGARNTLDWLLARSSGLISAAALIRTLKASNLAIVSTSPTAAMIEASVSQVSGFDVVVSKYEKHRRRLKAAIETGAMREGDS